MGLDQLVTAVETLDKIKSSNKMQLQSDDHLQISDNDFMPSKYLKKYAPAVKSESFDTKNYFSIQSIIGNESESNKQNFVYGEFLKFLSKLNKNGATYCNELLKKYSPETISEILQLNQYINNDNNVDINRNIFSTCCSNVCSSLDKTKNNENGEINSALNSDSFKLIFGNKDTFNSTSSLGVDTPSSIFKRSNSKVSSSFINFCDKMTNSNEDISLDINKVNPRTDSKDVVSVDDKNNANGFGSVKPFDSIIPRTFSDANRIIYSRGNSLHKVNNQIHHVNTLSDKKVFYPTSVIIDQSLTNNNMGSQSPSNNGALIKQSQSIVNVSQATLLKQQLLRLNKQDEDGDTMLHIAVAQENIEIGKSLITKMNKDGINIENYLGQTALHLACFMNFKEIVRDLILHGADVSKIDQQGNTAMHIACDKKLPHIVEIMLNCYRLDSSKFDKMFSIKNNEGLAPLHVAVKKKSDEIVKSIIKVSKDLNIQEQKSGETALLISLRMGCTEISKIIIDSKADVNISTFSGIYPLYYAAQLKDVELVDEILKKGGELGKAQELDNMDMTSKAVEIRKLLEKENRRRRRKRKQKDDT